MSRLFLKTIRFDASDTFSFPFAAQPDEWAVSGAFAFADTEPGALTGKPRQAFTNGLLGLTSFSHATFAAVANATQTDISRITDRLAHHFVESYGAPGKEAALPAARGEVEFIEDLIAGSLINTLFCVSRSFDVQDRIVERFRKLERRIDGGPIYLGGEQLPPAGSPSDGC